MCEYHRAGIVRQCGFGHFARMYAAAVDGASEQFLADNDAMSRVEVDTREDFVFEAVQAKPDVAFEIFR